MKKIGMFVDVSNLYYCIRHQYPGRKLDYSELWKYVSDLGMIQVAVAYGSQKKDQAAGFITCLKEIGFRVNFKRPKAMRSKGDIKHKADWDVGITIDIVNMIDNIDMVVLCTADGDMAPLVKWVMDKGIEVLVIASNPSYELKKEATAVVNIPESMLEKPKERKTIVEPTQKEIVESAQKVVDKIQSDSVERFYK